MIHFSPSMLSALQMSASGAGILGATLMALRIAPPRVAYSVWIVSNLIFFPYCIATSQWGVFAMNVAFLVINIAGITHWKSTPAVRSPAALIRNMVLRVR